MTKAQLNTSPVLAGRTIAQYLANELANDIANSTLTPEKGKDAVFAVFNTEDNIRRCGSEEVLRRITDNIYITDYNKAIDNVLKQTPENQQSNPTIIKQNITTNPLFQLYETAALQNVMPAFINMAGVLMDGSDSAKTRTLKGFIDLGKAQGLSQAALETAQKEILDKAPLIMCLPEYISNIPEGISDARGIADYMLGFENEVYDIFDQYYGSEIGQAYMKEATPDTLRKHTALREHVGLSNYQSLDDLLSIFEKKKASEIKTAPKQQTAPKPEPGKQDVPKKTPSLSFRKVRHVLGNFPGAKALKGLFHKKKHPTQDIDISAPATTNAAFGVSPKDLRQSTAFAKLQTVAHDMDTPPARPAPKPEDLPPKKPVPTIPTATKPLPVIPVKTPEASKDDANRPPSRPAPKPEVYISLTKATHGITADALQKSQVLTGKHQPPKKPLPVPPVILEGEDRRKDPEKRAEFDKAAEASAKMTGQSRVAELRELFGDKAKSKALNQSIQKAELKGKDKEIS